MRESPVPRPSTRRAAERLDSLLSAHTDVTETGQCGILAAPLVDANGRRDSIICSDAKLQRDPRAVASMSDCEREVSTDVLAVQSRSRDIRCSRGS
ncbi:hypothetical protein PsorP6_017408 [Peronosclerospora sorghi]|uniref:Uncharacterized protein n=1 Tax=Peronosclerospora sorghi TaxID=230839 RepID=A0ACC0WN67_9STRA|nr:hypothetical protein PsorP6_017408 [Peronosclerospora sorghi]